MLGSAQFSDGHAGSAACLGLQPHSLLQDHPPPSYCHSVLRSFKQANSPETEICAMAIARRLLPHRHILSRCDAAETNGATGALSIRNSGGLYDNIHGRNSLYVASRPAGNVHGPAPRRRRGARRPLRADRIDLKSARTFPRRDPGNAHRGIKRRAHKQQAVHP